MEWTIETVQRIARGWGDEVTLEGGCYVVKGSSGPKVKFRTLEAIVQWYDGRVLRIIERGKDEDVIAGR